jgi:superfamily II DNA/RNA helicase
MTFKDLGVNPVLNKLLHTSGIEKLFPIQKATLPDAIAGKDILGRGQTGSGKTLAFGLALKTRLAGRTARAGAVGTVVTLATHKQRKGVHGMATRAGVWLNDSTIRPMDANLVKVTGAAEPSGIPIVTASSTKSDGGGRSGGYRGARSRGGGKKKSRPRPHERRKRPR